MGKFKLLSQRLLVVDLRGYIHEIYIIKVVPRLPLCLFCDRVFCVRSKGFLRLLCKYVFQKARENINFVFLVIEKLLLRVFFGEIIQNFAL